MMKRVVVVITALAAMVLMSVRPAAAAGIDLWELLSELHGPGPFWGVQGAYKFLCVTRDSDARVLAGVLPTSEDKIQISWLSPNQKAASLWGFRSVTGDVRTSLANNNGDEAGRLL